jgi:hypothetical protein
VFCRKYATQECFVVEIFSLGDVFFKSYLAAQPKNFYVLFSARNQAKCTFYLPPLLLPFGVLACFVA